MKQVAHAVHEHPARLAPAQRLVEPIRQELDAGEGEVVLRGPRKTLPLPIPRERRAHLFAGVVARRTERETVLGVSAVVQREGVAVVASSRDARATHDGVPSRISPGNVCLVAHQRTSSTSLSGSPLQILQLFALRSSRSAFRCARPGGSRRKTLLR